MSGYGRVAVCATELLQRGEKADPRVAWDHAARQTFPESPSSQTKGCPRGAYLGLCEEGLVVKVTAGSYGRSEANKSYALRAVELLRKEPALAKVSPNELWSRVMAGRVKRHNSQMDVVLALWERKFIGPPKLRFP